MTHQQLDYATRIRAEGYRLTPQRQIILDTLCALGGHVPVTALIEAVREVSPAIDPATVYRSVAFFTQLGLMVSSDMEGVTVVEIGPAGEAGHGHLVCTSCGGVDHLPEPILDQLALAIRRECGFVPDLGHLTIAGTCDECRPEERATHAGPDR